MKKYYILRHQIDSNVGTRKEDTLVEVDGKDFQQDTRFFYHKSEKGIWILNDKKTGLLVAGGKTLNDLETNYRKVLNAYEEIIKGKAYKGFVARYKKMLKELETKWELKEVGYGVNQKNADNSYTLSVDIYGCDARGETIDTVMATYNPVNKKLTFDKKLCENFTESEQQQIKDLLLDNLNTNWEE